MPTLEQEDRRTLDWVQRKRTNAEIRMTIRVAQIVHPPSFRITHPSSAEPAPATSLRPPGTRRPMQSGAGSAGRRVLVSPSILPLPTGSARAYEMLRNVTFLKAICLRRTGSKAVLPTHLLTYAPADAAESHTMQHLRIEFTDQPTADAAESHKLQHFKNDLTADRRRTTRRLGAESNGVHHATLELEDFIPPAGRRRSPRPGRHQHRGRRGACGTASRRPPPCR
jgi:hypothetical protein